MRNQGLEELSQSDFDKRILYNQDVTQPDEPDKDHLFSEYAVHTYILGSALNSAETPE